MMVYLVYRIIGIYSLLTEHLIHVREGVGLQILYMNIYRASPNLLVMMCVLYSVHRLHGYAEAEQWWPSCEPDCVGLEGLSESSVTDPASDSCYAYSPAGFFLGPLTVLGMRFAGEESAPRG